MRFSTLKYAQKKPATLLAFLCINPDFMDRQKKQSNCSKNIENHKKAIIYI